jgi:membrane fusion protein, multidrug efflux system
MRANTLLYILVPVVLIAGAATYHRTQRNTELNHQTKVKAEGLLAVTLVPVEEHAFRPAVPFTGNLLAVNRAELKGEVTGRMTRVVVQEGDTAQLAQARAQALQAQRDNDRAISLLEKRSITKQSAQQAETASNATRAAVQAAESNLGLARLRLKKARIVAPFAGQVARRLVQPGEMLNPGQAAFEVVDNRKLEIQANLSAEVMGLVKPGLSVTFRTAGIGHPVAGTLTQVSPSLSADGRTLRVRIEVPNADGQLKGGLFVEGVILGQGEVKLPALPATLLKAESGDADLFVAQEGVAHRRKVSLGVEQNGFRPVQGLALKDMVIDGGKDLVGEGTRLQVMTTPAGGK